MFSKKYKGEKLMDKITTRRFLSQTKKFDIQLDRIMMRRDYYQKQMV